MFINSRRDDEAAEEAASAVEEVGGQAHRVKGDVSTPESAQDVVDRVSETVDHLDQVVVL